MGEDPGFKSWTNNFENEKNMYFQTPLHLSWFSTQWRPEASHWVHGGAISRRLMATFASWGACTVTSWSEEEKKDAAPERRRTLGWRVIWGQNIRGKLFRWYFQLLLWNLKTSSLRFKLDLMPPKRLVGRWMKTRKTKRLGEVCHSSSCDRRQIERHGENWYFLIVTWLESEAKYFYSRHFPIQKTSKWVPSDLKVCKWWLLTTILGTTTGKVPRRDPLWHRRFIHMIWNVIQEDFFSAFYYTRN